MNTLVLLKTILITVASKDGPIVVRALFDDGSHKSYMTTRLAKRTKGREIGKFFERNILFGGILSDVEERTIFEVTLGALNKKTENWTGIGRQRSDNRRDSKTSGGMLATGIERERNLNK